GSGRSPAEVSGTPGGGCRDRPASPRPSPAGAGNKPSVSDLHSQTFARLLPVAAWTIVVPNLGWAGRKSEAPNVVFTGVSQRAPRIRVDATGKLCSRAAPQQGFPPDALRHHCRATERRHRQ